MHIQFFPLPFPLDLKFYYHFRRQAFEEKIEYPSSLDKKGHLVRAVICEADFFPPPSLTTFLTGGVLWGTGGLLLGPLRFWGNPKVGLWGHGAGLCGGLRPDSGVGEPPVGCPP